MDLAFWLVDLLAGIMAVSLVFSDLDASELERSEFFGLEEDEVAFLALGETGVFDFLGFLTGGSAASRTKSSESSRFIGTFFGAITRNMNK